MDGGIFGKPVNTQRNGKSGVTWEVLIFGDVGSTQ